MTDQLSPQARDLLDSAKHADDPSSDDRSRVRARVLAAVATGGLASGAAASAAASSSVASGAAASGVAAGGIASLGSVATKGFLVLALVGTGTAGVVTVSRSEVEAPVTESSEANRPTAPTTPATTSPAQPMMEPAAEARPDPEPEALPSPVASTPRPQRPRPTLAVSVDVPIEPIEPIEAPSLASELSILRAAQRARSEGDPRAALRHLDEHARTFPLGSLAAERDGTRVLALCDAGEVASARAAADAFLASHPNSPLRQRVSTACR